MRRTITHLENEIQLLRAAVPPAPPIPAPPSSPQTLLERAGYEASLAAAAAAAEYTESINIICTLPAGWVRSWLAERREATSEIGCWLGSNRAGHTNGYVKANLRNTRHPVTGRLVGAQVFIHQLAVVAKGGANYLRSASVGGPNEVSHLCHTPGCFNPDHVMVEARALNKSRAMCQGHFIYELDDGTVINPCRHGSEGWHKRCILPTRHVGAGKYYVGSEDGPVAL